jgi:hypothetical protein
MSLRINSPDVDPRAIVPSIVAASGARVIFDVLRPTKDMADIVVTANLSYDRLDFLVPRKGSASEARAAYYGELASRPHLDVSNGRPTVAHFNPVVRIVPWTDRCLGFRRSPRKFEPPPRA